MRKKLWILAVAALLVIAIWLADFLDAAGVFVELEPHTPGVCTKVAGVVGAEDITIDPETGVAYISACDRRRAGRGEAVRGGLYAYDLAASEPRIRDLTPDAGPDFQPHGMSLYRAPDGTRVLFVINHGGGEHAVEIFDLRNGRLVHRARIRGEQLVSPNDVAGVGADAFYVTNDHGHPSGFMRTLEDYLRLRSSSVYYYDGGLFHRVLSGVGAANGINTTPDGRTLYLDAASERMLYVYDRDPGTGDLSERARVAIGGFPDNVELSEEGDLLIAVHVKVLELVAHMKDASALSPSEIILISIHGERPYTREMLYLDLGRQISGASVGAIWKDRMLIGAIFEPFLLDCRLAPSS